MKKRLFASMFFGLITMTVCAFCFNFAHNPEWFERSINYGTLSGVYFFFGTIMDKRL